jgi:hypothetical protein
MQTINKHQFLSETNLKETDLRAYDNVEGGPEGFGFFVESFSEVAQALGFLAAGAGHNEHSWSMNPHLILTDDVYSLMQAAQMEYIPNVGYEVYFPGWQLT